MKLSKKVATITAVGAILAGSVLPATLSAQAAGLVQQVGGNTFRINPGQDAKLLAGSPTVAVEGNLKLTGSGNGFQIKFGINGANGYGVSFGMQFQGQNGFGNGVLNNKTVFLIENVTGAHVYSYYTNPSASSRTAVVKLAYYQAQKLAAVYVNHKLISVQRANISAMPAIGKASNAFMVSEQVSAMKNGNTVKGTFSNVKVTGLPVAYSWTNPAVYPVKVWSSSNLKGISGSNGNFTLGGTIKGLAPGQDWDSNSAATIGGVQEVVGHF